MADGDEPREPEETAEPEDEDGAINDPLTRRGVEAPRAPFEADEERG